MLWYKQIQNHVIPIYRAAFIMTGGSFLHTLDFIP